MADFHALFAAIDGMVKVFGSEEKFKKEYLNLKDRVRVGLLEYDIQEALRRDPFYPHCTRIPQEIKPVLLLLKSAVVENYKFPKQ